MAKSKIQSAGNIQRYAILMELHALFPIFHANTKTVSHVQR